MCIISITNSMQNAKTTPGDKKVEATHQRINDSSDLKHLYNFGQKLGSGCFGIVIKAQDKMRDKDFAIKIIIKAKANNNIGSERFRSIEREIIILKMVNHPHIIHLEKVYESPKKIYLILELCREELAEAFKRKQIFTEDETRYVLKQLVSAVCYLHKNLIIHRDLKLENILLATNPNNPSDLFYIKVSDFGLGIIRQGIGIDDMLHDCCGTLTYMAPEMLSQNYNQQCDVWSMGIIMYLLLKGEFPFFSHQEKELARSIRRKEPSFTGINLSAEGFHLLTKMLAKDPILRIAPSEIEQHPWISNQRMAQSYHDTNIVDMMKTWKDEMMTTVGNECDWIALPHPITENLSYDDINNLSLSTMTTIQDEKNHSAAIKSITSAPKKSKQSLLIKSASSAKESNRPLDIDTTKIQKTQQSNSRVMHGGREKDEKSIQLKSGMPLNKDRKIVSTGTTVGQRTTNSSSANTKKRDKQ